MGSTGKISRLFGPLYYALCIVIAISISAPCFAAVTLPFFDAFDGTTIDSKWSWTDQSFDGGATWLQNETLAIEAKGRDIWTNWDQYAAMYLPRVNGDFTAVVQVVSQDVTNGWAKAGLMVRNKMPESGSSKGYVFIGITPTNGFVCQWDKNNNGYLDGNAQAGSPTPPNAWVKLVKSGTTFKSYYSSDGSSWTHITTVTLNTARTEQDVGLFVTSHTSREASTVIFDHFSISGTEAQYQHYRDADGDTYGSASSGVKVTASQVPPTGYSTSSNDCDDSNPNVFPGNPEVCDGLDNDCNGSIDDGVGTTTYYRDLDGDGYGTNVDTRVGCSVPSGYAENTGDCDDGNPLIFPGAYDKCGDNIDQDCSGTDATCEDSSICLDIADVPLVTQIESAPPLVMLLLDDSGSMAWDVLCPENNGKFNGKTSVSSVTSYWKSQWSGYNNIYYNPSVTYTPWPTKDAADKDTPLDDPSETTTQPLNDQFVNLSGVSIPYAHYYVWSAEKSAAYLVTLEGSVKYYRVSASSASSAHATVSKLTKESPPSDIVVTYATQRQNFANWYTYYRTRQQVAKASLGKVIDGASGIMLGMRTIHGRVNVPVRAINIQGEPDNTSDMLDELYSVISDGGTPLRLGLEDIGQYFDATDNDKGNIGDSPYASADDGGACQHAFAIVMTDGYYNGDSPSVANSDGPAAKKGNTAFDGYHYGDGYSNTLADVAMKYYETDLSTLDNSLTTSVADEARHQHMVTYTISFGLSGTLKYNGACPGNPASCPSWSDPTNGDDEKIDDLWHAAVNGRGEFLTASDTEELTKALEALFTDIDNRSRTGAPVSLNTQKIKDTTAIYQTFFKSEDWSGDLQAWSLTTPSVKQWSVKSQLNAITATSRKILTFNGSTGIPFRYANLTSRQKVVLTADEVDYLRGDSSRELSKGSNGIFRNRGGKLGDIVNSSPLYFNNMVFAGANDGMLHCFDATNGNEKFSYVPGLIFENLKDYPDPDYDHNYYVDNTPYATTVGSKSYLIGSLGRGGRGLFGIDVSSASSISESSIPNIWEYPGSGGDDDMGFSYSKVTMVKTNASTTSDSLVLFGNGYDSQNGHAVLYFLKPDGTLFQKIDTGAGSLTPGSCNGLSTPTPIDINYDGKVDYIYAGDLLGNLWKFDVTSADPSTWAVAYKNGSTDMPLFQAKSAGGGIQPITGKPDVMFHCDGSKKGYIVVFGTGKYLSFSDTVSRDVQSIYGIWDWAAEWEDLGATSEEKAFGSFKAPAGGIRKLSNIDGSSALSGVPALTLLQQAQASVDDNFRESSSNEIKWFSPKKFAAMPSGGSAYSGGNHVGWYFDLPTSGERVITEAQVHDGKAVVVSIIPSQSMCSAGGSSIVHVLDACSGGQLDDPQFDTNKDNDIDKDDDSKSGKVFDNIYYAPTIIDDKMIFDKDTIVKTKKETTGMYYWRTLD